MADPELMADMTFTFCQKRYVVVALSSICSVVRDRYVESSCP